MAVDVANGGGNGGGGGVGNGGGGGGNGGGDHGEEGAGLLRGRGRHSPEARAKELLRRDKGKRAPWEEKPTSWGEFPSMFDAPVPSWGGRGNLKLRGR